MAVTQEEHLKELAKGYRFDWKDPSIPSSSRSGA